MARLPTLDDLGRRPVPTSNREIASEGKLAGIVGSAVSDLGQTVSQVGQHFIEKQDRLDAAAAKSAVLKADVAARLELQDDPDYETWGARYTAKMKAAQEAAGGLIKTNSGRQLFMADAELDTLRGSAELAKLATARRINARKGTLSEGLINLQDVGQNAPDDATREATLNTANEMINAAAAIGTITPEEAVQQRRSFTQSYVVQRIEALRTQGQVEEAQRYLDANRGRIDPAMEIRLNEQIHDATENRDNLNIVEELFSAPTAPAGAMGAAGVQSLAAVPVPASGKPPAGNLARMVEITAVSESGNRERDGRGRLVTSHAGAQGRMQVMPATARNPGYGIRPWDGKSDEDRSRVGRELLAALVTRHGGDAAKAWASYNWDSSGNRVDRAVAKYGNDWLKHTPAETQAYVAKNVKALGGTTVAAGPVTYGGAVGPDLKDLESRIEARADAEGWTPERKAKVREMAMARATNLRVVAEREREETFNRALAKADALGGTFTDVSQLGDEFYRSSATDQHRLRSMADANRKALATGTEVEANGDVVRSLHVMAIEDPKKFAGLNLSQYRPHMNAAEFDEVSSSQARARVEAAKPPTGKDAWNPRTGIQAAISWGKDFGGVELTDGEDKYRVYRFMEARAREWSAANGGKVPTENEYQTFFREATQETKVQRSFLGFDRLRPDSTQRSHRVLSPVYKGMIIRQFRAQFGRAPNEAEMQEWFDRMGEELK